MAETPLSLIVLQSLTHMQSLLTYVISSCTRGVMSLCSFVGRITDGSTQVCDRRGNAALISV
jgi:hypothetical protein